VNASMSGTARATGARAYNTLTATEIVRAIAAMAKSLDIAIAAEQIIYTKRVMAERIAHHTGQTVEQIEIDFDRDRWFTAQEAKEYGFVDQVLTRNDQLPKSTS